MTIDVGHPSLDLPAAVLYRHARIDNDAERSYRCRCGDWSGVTVPAHASHVAQQLAIAGLLRPVADDALAAALIEAGFDPPPYVGEVWIDELGPSAPGATTATATITALGNTVSGWQARVVRREFNAAGHVIYTGQGRIYVEHLTSGKAPFGYVRAVRALNAKEDTRRP